MWRQQQSVGNRQLLNVWQLDHFLRYPLGNQRPGTLACLASKIFHFFAILLALFLEKTQLFNILSLSLAKLSYSGTIAGPHTDYVCAWSEHSIALSHKFRVFILGAIVLAA